MAPPLLEVRELSTRVGRGREAFLAVDRVSFQLERGGALGLVGESGCGKTLLALSVMRLLPAGAERAGGEVLLEGRELLGLPAREMERVRGRRVAMVFQDPMGSLNPVFPVGQQIAEAVRLHGGVGAREGRAQAVEALRAVGIAEPERQARSYPHQLSGGMRQRAMIAMALACRADVLLADEPTTSLDATVQAQILDLLARLRAERGLALVFITHDLPVMARLCQGARVMYAGQVVEAGPAAGLLEAPEHPYTAALCRAIPPGRPRAGGPRLRLEAIPGRVPSPSERGAGCPFAPRCQRASSECREARPQLRELGGDRAVACFHPLGARGGGP